MTRPEQELDSIDSLPMEADVDSVDDGSAADTWAAAWARQNEAYERQYQREMFWRAIRGVVTGVAIVIGGIGLGLAGLAAIFHVASEVTPAVALVGAVVFVGFVGLVLVFTVLRVSHAIQAAAIMQGEIASDPMPPRGGIFR